MKNCIANTMIDLIGSTPLLHIQQDTNAHAGKIFAKLEYQNPSGSVKDRAAAAMILHAEQAGVLRAGSTIIEPTSGNTGIGLAAIGAAKGYRVILTMPETMSTERRNLLAAYGAEIVLTEGALGMSGCVAKAAALCREIPGSFMPSQFTNPQNPDAHYATTGPEIWDSLSGQVDAFVACVGTGGTLSGTGQYLKEQNPAAYIVAVEPAASPLLSKGKAGKHGIQGIGANFIPETLNQGIFDEVLCVADADAFAAMRHFARTQGMLIGISSGAALCAAEELASRPDFAGKNVVTLFPDSGERYLSTGIFQSTRKEGEH